jgi:hypothetical protein
MKSGKENRSMATKTITTKKTAAKKKTAKKKTSKASRPKSRPKVKTLKINDTCPFRSGAYAVLWQLLFDHRKTGIRRDALLKLATKHFEKPEKNIAYDLAVVISPNSDGTAHRSAHRASDTYYVEKTNDHLKMILRKKDS